MARHGEGISEISVGALLVVTGVVVLLALSVAGGLITTLFGLIGLGGFASGKWT